ncbi:MAG: helix-turn-helix domain-containing protein [Christensenellales bacterium]
MEELRKDLIKYREKNSYSLEECAKQLKLDANQLKDIEEGKITLSGDEITRISELIKPHKSGKRMVRILDLIFRLGSTIMALVVLLLCINGYSETQTLIALLSVGVVCSAFTILPKIEK